MTKLTKTETELLRRAKASRHGCTSVLVSLGGGFRPRSVGTRERSAATSLRVKGLFRFEKSDSYTVYGYGGSSTHCWESLWFITDAGRNTALEG